MTKYHVDIIMVMHLYDTALAFAILCLMCMLIIYLGDKNTIKQCTYKIARHLFIAMK